jgi:hypothetical protein
MQNPHESRCHLVELRILDEPLEGLGIAFESGTWSDGSALEPRTRSWPNTYCHDALAPYDPRRDRAVILPAITGGCQA